MNDQKPESKSALPWPHCPKCGARLISKGKIVDTRGFKEWTDAWICPIHCSIKLPDDREQRSAPD